MNMDLHTSSKTNEWATPQAFFDEINKEFNFSIDVCATAENAKCENYYSIDSNALTKTWVGVCWMNPPYSRDLMPLFLEKAYRSSKEGATVVGLIPAKTDTKAFHKYINNKAEARFIKGRLKFGGAPFNAPFPSILVIWRALR